MDAPSRTRRTRVTIIGGGSYQWTPKLMAAIQRLPEVIDVSTNLESRSPRIDLVIDRDKAAAVGLNASSIANALGTGLGPRWSTTIYGQRSQYRVLLELDPKYQQQADTLEQLAFKAPNGQMVPLESVVTFKETVGPQTVNHIGQLPAVSIRSGRASPFRPRASSTCRLTVRTWCRHGRPAPAARHHR